MHLPTLTAWLTARFNLGAREERGANLVEYIVLIAFIVLLLILAITFFKDRVGNEFTEAGNSLETAGT